MNDGSEKQNIAIVTTRDVETIRAILTHIANHDATALNRLENVVVPSNPAFWSSLENLPVRLIPPPNDFIDSWSISLFLSKKCVWCRGPMWSEEEGESEMYLYLSKDLSETPPKIHIEDYRLP